MSETAHENYQEILTINFHLFSKYIVPEDFLEQLISSNVLSVDDKELITNPFTNQSRRERANKLIETLMTRGHAGYEKFLEILEYQYPHVYKDVTKKEPRPPPTGTVRNRTSDRLRMINDLPNLAQHIKEQFQKNTELGTQLEVLQNILEFSKEENAALEKEIETLKNVKVQNENLKRHVENLENDRNQQQTDINKEMQRSLQYVVERDEYRDKCQALQVNLDELTQKYTELKKDDHIARGLSRANTGPTTRDSPTSSKPHLPPKPNAVEVDGGHDHRAKHMVAKTSILEAELENYKMQCEEIAAKLERSEDNVTRMEQDLEMHTKELNKRNRENKVVEVQLKHANKRLESYCEIIRKKDAEMTELQTQKLEEQQKYNQLLREKNEITQRNHKLGQDLEQLQFTLDKIEAQRNSGSSLDNNSSFNSGSDEDAGDLERRKNCKKYNFGGRYTDRCGFPVSHADDAFRNPNTADAIVSEDGSVTDLSLFKASTLPVFANDTSEMVFQREVACFRYSRRQELLRKQASISSMDVQDGSMKKGRQSKEEEDPMMFSNFNYSFLYDGSVKREPVSHPADVEDNASASSASTVYIARTSDPALSHGNSISQKGPLPKGGKRFLKRDKVVVGETCLDASDNMPNNSGDKSDNMATSRDDDLDNMPPGSATDLSNRACDFFSYDVCTQLLPRECLSVSHGQPDSFTYRTVSLKSSILDKVEITGGNHTGIYISNLLKAVDLKEGEEIKEIIYTPNEKADPVVAHLKGCMLDDAHRLLSDDYIRRKKEKEVKIKVRKCLPEYESACKWMKDNNDTGDFLFIRCNVAIEHRSPEEISLNPSEVFLVTNSHYCKKRWSGHKVDLATGQIMPMTAVIPTQQEAILRRMPMYSRSLSEDEREKDDKKRRKGVKFRGQTYDRVLPMKASVMLPVYIFGPKFVVNALIDLISAELSSSFMVDVSDNDCRPCVDSSELFKQDVHVIKRGRLDMLSQKSVHRILVFVDINAVISPLVYTNLFGEEFEQEISSDTIPQCKNLREKIVENGQNFEEIILPNFSTKDSLLKSFTSCIKSSQERILWLSSTEMDKVVADRYSKYLGQNCDLSNIMASVQMAQSYDQL